MESQTKHSSGERDLDGQRLKAYETPRLVVYGTMQATTLGLAPSPSGPTT
jgi:hypothetical protein